MPRVGLGKRTRLPTLKVLDRSYTPFSYFRTFWPIRDFNLKQSGDYFELTNGTTSMKLKRFHATAFVGEWPAWKRYYLPKVGIRGKTVLDIGAGCGETAYFFLKNGARSVECVEADEEAGSLLLENIRRNGWNANPHLERFSISHLSLKHDFVKIDCEGGESLLLDGSVARLEPCRVEMHKSVIGETAVRQLIEKFSLKCINGSDLWGLG